MSEWHRTDDLANPAPVGIFVETKIDDGKGLRNEATLRRHGRLWFTPGDNAMYVYYTPTHWRRAPSAQEEKP